MAKRKGHKIIGEIPLKYNIPDNIISRFTTNMVVQRIENEFKISFFEVSKPILITKEDIDNFKKIKSIDATCVASVIVTPDRLEKFIVVLADQLKKYNEEDG